MKVTLIHTIIGIIGNVISFGLFLSPVPTFIRIFKNKDVEEFQFYPYLGTVLNCLFWIFYGLPFVTPNSILVVTINGVGLVLELIYLFIFCYYDKQNKGRKRVILGLLAEVVFMAVIILIAMLVFRGHLKQHRNLFVGIFCDIFNVMMYFLPLLIMRKVITTKSVEYMPFYLSLAGFLNGVCWTAYSLVMFDLFILISNGLGALGGAAQLILYFKYYKTTPKKSEKKASEVQLPAATNV